MILNICNFKKGIRIESEKLLYANKLRSIVWRHVEDIAQWLLYNGNIHSKAFVIHILTAILSTINQI